MKKDFAKKFVAGSALVGMLAVAGIAADGPTIRTVPTFKTGFFPGTRTYTNYVELGVSFPSTGTYYMAMSTNLSDSNGWKPFGKTNEVSIANTNTTKYVAEYAPSNLNHAYFRINEKTNSPSPSPSPAFYIPTKSLAKRSK